MSAKSVHPFYTAMFEKWQLGRHSYEGEDAIKKAGKTYLPATSGQIADGATIDPNSLGAKAYEAYKMRAVYPDLYKEAVEAAIGIMHREPPKIDLPEALEGMREDCTLLGEDLEMLLRKINAHQLSTGRLGLLGDIRKDGVEVRPVIAIYNELAIRNWDDTSINDDDVDVRLVVLDESGYEMDSNLEWTQVEKYRILGLVGPEGALAQNGVYASTLLKENDEVVGAVLTPPSLLGTQLDQIPFVFVNSKDLSPTPDSPPLDGLAKLCLAIYRGEADYRQNLFMQGQDTLVRIGAHGDEDDIVRTGAGSRIDVPLGGDAKYIGVNSQGLPEQRQALENDYKRAVQKSGQLLDATSRAKESGDALRIRVAAQTATLVQIAKTGAAALERVLKSLARWYGANEDDVKVTPNLNFTEADLNGQTLLQIVQSKGLGAPISEESIHEWMQDQGFTKLTYEEELKRLAEEEPAPGSDLVSPVDQPAGQQQPGQKPPAQQQQGQQVNGQ
jgi:hypothetical protein